MSRYHAIAYVGPNGSGKGTQIRLSGLPSVPMSSALIDFADDPSTPLNVSREIKMSQKNKELVSDALTALALMRYLRINLHGKNATLGEKFALDGFPRTAQQALLLGEIAYCYQFDVTVVYIDGLSDEVLQERSRERARPDDTPDGVAKRLADFRNNINQMMDVLEKFHWGCHKIALSSEQTPEDVQALIQSL